MYKPNKVKKAIFQITAEWFLEHAPVQEVGGFISQIIGDYRDGFYTKPHALKILEVEHQVYIEKYIYRSSEILMEMTY
jgi:hypothetical protein